MSEPSGTGGQDAAGSGGASVGSGSTTGSTGGTTAVAGTGGMVEADPCQVREGSLTAELVSIAVENESGEAPKKGDRLKFRVTLRNTGTGVGQFAVTPRITSQRFSDYENVPVGREEAILCEGETVFEVETGPFLDDEERGKHYAIGSGGYTVSRLDLAPLEASSEASEIMTDTAFQVATSSALLVPVIYDPGYFESIPGLTTDTPEAYLIQEFTRPVQVFTPDSSADQDGPGTFQEFPGGFDEMMNVRHMFRTFLGFPGENTTEQGWCEDATYHAQNTLGMASAWETATQETRPERHGFDYLLAISPDLGGGVACSWIDVQVTGMIGNEINRQQIVSVHETAHIFGAPHCDDLGNGSGGPLQNYVMCSGEKHANYPEKFVFHSESRAKMSSRWN